MNDVTKGKTILVLGGGLGGVVVATELRKKLSSKHKVILVERENNYVFSPSLPWLMIGTRRRKDITRSRAKLTKLGVEIISGDIEKINAIQRSVQVNQQTLIGDYLIIALGVEYADETIPGLVEAGNTFYNIDGAEKLNEARLKFNSGRIAVLVTSLPFKCPAAPVEAALLLENDCRKRNIRDAVQVDMYTPEPGPMSLSGPENSKQLRAMVEARNITYHAEHKVTEVDAENKKIIFANGVTADFDLLAYVPPHQAPKVVIDAGLVGESGWIPVDKFNLKTKFDNVYAIGDVTGIKLSVGKPLPKAGVIAHGQAEVVVHNIVHEISGQGSSKKFEGRGACFIETGAGKAGMGNGNFYAEPKPQMKLHKPGYLMHLGKVAFEKYWLFKWF
ncbi:FAD-dependent pyridine nucleotide-disulphide oxidoreductase [hydrothermal vent metagenome]|uniref:FAD-dependent pyridine nucleotide-disulphide oxidoreductase n=1 Tax=hydrothermal vent metagenome TaxID=652676 RepID=A0A3B0ZH65_9ZZZZ